MKRIIEAALDDADIPFVPNQPFDFHLPAHQLHIHVLPAGADTPIFRHSDADLIVVRGRQAVNQLADWIRGDRANPE